MRKGKQRRIILAAKRIELTGLLADITDTKILLNRAYTDFNNSVDPELIEACVFEINSLHSRYSYLIRKVKENEGPNDKQYQLSNNTVFAPKGDPI